ncbi:MAG: hypothetical protein AAFN42_12380 [Cyanobacteria bacterium J06554_1]
MGVGVSQTLQHGAQALKTAVWTYAGCLSGGYKRRMPIGVFNVLGDG